MLYLLLIIIAIGVLLISPAGKSILKWLVILAVAGAVLFAAIVGLVIMYEDFSQELAVLLGLAGIGGIIKGTPVLIRIYKEFND